MMSRSTITLLVVSTLAAAVGETLFVHPIFMNVNRALATSSQGGPTERWTRIPEMSSLSLVNADTVSVSSPHRALIHILADGTRDMRGEGAIDGKTGETVYRPWLPEPLIIRTGEGFTTLEGTIFRAGEFISDDYKLVSTISGVCVFELTGVDMTGKTRYRNTIVIFPYSSADLAHQ